MPVAGIYGRQSFFKEDSCSVDLQIERGIAYCASQGWDYIVYDIDRGYSGKDTDRPGFQQMMLDIRSGKINCVVVYRIDRISRSLVDFFELMEDFNTYGVDFRSLTENFDTSTPMGRAMLSIIAVFAQLERETIAERVQDNMYGRFNLGIWNGGPVPYGFDKEKTTIEINGKPKKVSLLYQKPDEVEWISKMLDWYLSPNGSVIKTTKQANMYGFKTKTGCDWNTNQVQRILSNPLYVIADDDAYEYFSSLGVKMPEKEKFDGEHGLMYYGRRKTHKRTTRLRETSEWVLAVGFHKGFIPGAKYAAVQRKLESKGYMPPRSGTGGKGLLPYLVKCGKCGKSMIHQPMTDTWSYYKCRGHQHQGTCSGLTVRSEELESLVISTIKELCADKASLESIARKSMANCANAGDPLIKERRHLLAQLTELENEQMELIKALGKKTLPIELVEKRVGEIEKIKLPLSAAVDELTIRIENETNQQVDLELFFGNLLRFNDVFDGLEFLEKRELLRSIIKDITCTEDEILLRLFFMPDPPPLKPDKKKKGDLPGSDDPNGGTIDGDGSGTFVMQGCNCGFLGDSSRLCTCSPHQIGKYFNRLSGPLMDRIDLQIEVPRVPYEDLVQKDGGETSAEIKRRVMNARSRQAERYHERSITVNAEMSSQDIRKECALGEDAENLLKTAFHSLSLSARGYDRVLKVARTIADIEGSEDIKPTHIAEAIGYRGIERKYTAG